MGKELRTMNGLDARANHHESCLPLAKRKQNLILENGNTNKQHRQIKLFGSQLVCIQCYWNVVGNPCANTSSIEIVTEEETISAAMEAFIHFKCFTLLAFLYLIVSSGLPPGVICKHSKNSVLDNASSSMHDKFFYYVGSLPTSFDANSPSVSSPSSSSSTSSLTPLTPAESSVSTITSRNKGTLITTSNQNANHNDNNNNILQILTNNNKRRSHSAARSYKHDDDNNEKHDKEFYESNKRYSSPVNDDYEDTTTIGMRNVIPDKNKFHKSAAASSSLSSYSTASDSFPAMYLMNSHYELESPLISNPVDVDGSRGEVNGDLSDRVSIINSYIRRSSASATKTLPLLFHNDDDDDGSNSNNGEISSAVVTSLPAVALADANMALQQNVDEPDSVTPSLDNDNGGGDLTTEEYMNTVVNNVTGTTPLRGKCNETLQCFGEHVECRLGICKCQLGYLPRVDNGDLCGEASAHHVEVPTTDPTMIGVVVGLALMSVTLCVVLRLFAKARFRENRTIFNTPNPRLMNVSLLKGSKTLLRGNSAGGQRSRRGSQVSMASGQVEGQSPTNPMPDGNGMSAAAGSSHPHRVKPSRTLSTDTTNLEGTPTSSRPISSVNRNKFRQDSVASNV
ncbi:unnamed protein product [Orchesella dallaii]|uniref:EB domain-containing protein n=1 Tax=Orchesella dallaii TaxID=48710 RepID=A0ABP1QP07_9HEXA